MSRDVTCKLLLHLDDVKDKKVYDYLKSKTASERKSAIVEALLSSQKEELFIKKFTAQQETSIAKAISAGNTELVKALIQLKASIKINPSYDSQLLSPEMSTKMSTKMSKTPVEMSISPEPATNSPIEEPLIKSNVPDFLKQMKSNFEI